MNYDSWKEAPYQQQYAHEEACAARLAERVEDFLDDLAGAFGKDEKQSFARWREEHDREDTEDDRRAWARDMAASELGLETD